MSAQSKRETAGGKAIGRVGIGEVGRSAATAVVLARHTLRLLRRMASAEPVGTAMASELRQAFERLGTTYVKLAQIIASSPGLFPEVLSDEFRACLDKVPPVSYETVRQVIVEELGAAPEQLFASFDPEPLASASIAQVHAARLPDGDEVVVKVQRPQIRSTLEKDIRILMLAAQMLEHTTPRGRMANPVAVVEDFAATIDEELHFMIEARSMERFERSLRSFGNNDAVRVPRVYWSHSTQRVLTMERIYGYKIDDLVSLRSKGWDLAERLKTGVRAWLEAALEHGFFHGDLHAGNLMLDTDRRVVFLDFGITGSLSPKTREVLRRGLPALLLKGDFVEVARTIYELGAVLKPVDLEESSRDIAEIVQPILGKPLSEISYGKVLVDIVRIGTRYEVRMPRELVLVAKQLLYFERYAKLMAPDWTVLNDPELFSFFFRDQGTGTRREPSSGPKATAG